MITHPEKLLFPDDGITKGELCAYYEAMAPIMLPHVSGRPITMERFPAGIGKKGFIQKDISKGFPAWLERVAVPKKPDKDGRDVVHYPVAREARALLWLANQNSVTPHVWTSRLPRLDRPDACVFDLDPSQDQPATLRAAALAVRDLLDELGLPSFVKTSGSKGFHIVVPLDGDADFPSVWRFAHGAGAVLVKRHPDTLTQEFIKADRAGRILIDTGRNGMGATFAAVYAVRPQPGAPVSAPCSWQEIERAAVGPRTFTLRAMAGRTAEVGDLWGAMERAARSLRAPMAALERLLTEEDWSEATAATAQAAPGALSHGGAGARTTFRRAANGVGAAL
jgi:bifunctional non-homologous end joining protein LigD